MTIYSNMKKLLFPHHTLTNPYANYKQAIGDLSLAISIESLYSFLLQQLKFWSEQETSSWWFSMLAGRSTLMLIRSLTITIESVQKLRTNQNVSKADIIRPLAAAAFTYPASLFSTAMIQQLTQNNGDRIETGLMVYWHQALYRLVEMFLVDTEENTINHNEGFRAFLG